MKEQVADVLRADAGVVAVVPADRIWTKPLVRPGTVDPDAAGYDETPEAFESATPQWLKTNIVVGSRIDRNRDRNRRTLDTQTARWGITIAYYVPPDSEDDLMQMSRLVGSALTAPGVTIELPGGQRGRVVIPHDLSPSVPAPEFPGAGFVLLERIELPTVWARG